MYELLWIVVICFLPVWAAILLLLLFGHFMAALVVGIVSLIFNTWSN